MCGVGVESIPLQNLNPSNAEATYSHSYDLLSDLDSETPGCFGRVQNGTLRFP